jgi:hypothetical protein
MARVIYGESITELIGSIGGMTFQRNSSGTIARLKPKPPVNPSQLQSDQQYLLAQLVALWPTLTVVQKASWNALAAAHDHITPWGETRTLNGYQWFLSCNLYCLLASDPVQVTAPAYAPPAPPSAFTLTAAAGDLTCEFGAAYTAVPDHLFIYLTLPIRANSLKLRRSMYLVSINNVFNASSLSVKALFESLAHVTWAAFYGSADTNIICRLVRVKDNTGMNSAFTSSLVKI